MSELELTVKHWKRLQETYQNHGLWAAVRHELRTSVYSLANRAARLGVRINLALTPIPCTNYGVGDAHAYFRLKEPLLAELEELKANYRNIIER